MELTTQGGSAPASVSHQRYALWQDIDLKLTNTFLKGLFPSLTFLHLNKDMFSEELQAVPVELEDVTESSRLTENH